VDSASAALDRITQSGPDLLLCDIGLPETDGCALIGIIRGREREARVAPLPAVALSAFTRDEDAQRALDAGFHYYVRKPVDPGELLKTLAMCVHSHSS